MEINFFHSGLLKDLQNDPHKLLPLIALIFLIEGQITINRKQLSKCHLRIGMKYKLRF